MPFRRTAVDLIDQLVRGCEAQQVIHGATDDDCTRQERAAIATTLAEKRTLLVAKGVTATLPANPPAPSYREVLDPALRALARLGGHDLDRLQRLLDAIGCEHGTGPFRLLHELLALSPDPIRSPELTRALAGSPLGDFFQDKSFGGSYLEHGLGARLVRRCAAAGPLSGVRAIGRRADSEILFLLPWPGQDGLPYQRTRVCVSHGDQVEVLADTFEDFVRHEVARHVDLESEPEPPSATPIQAEPNPVLQERLPRFTPRSFDDAVVVFRERYPKVREQIFKYFDGAFWSPAADINDYPKNGPENALYLIDSPYRDQNPHEALDEGVYQLNVWNSHGTASWTVSPGEWMIADVELISDQTDGDDFFGYDDADVANFLLAQWRLGDGRTARAVWAGCAPELCQIMGLDTWPTLDLEADVRYGE